jgi:outer membrane receptor for ferrienterochelin and colicin
MPEVSQGKSRLTRIGHFLAILFLIFAPSLPARGSGDNPPRFDAEEAMFWGEEEVLISATFYAAPLKMTPVIASVITGEEIREMGARDIKDVLITMPGINVVESPTALGMDNIIIRGWGQEYSSEILFMIDGHRLNTVAGGEPLDLYDDMMVDDIKRIEVIRGPVSSLYGADAMSGVINIITKDWDDVDGLEISGSGGSWETFQGNALFGKKLGELGIFVDINYLSSNGPHLQVEQDSIYGLPASRSPGLTEHNREKFDIDLKLGYENLSFKGRYTKKRHGPYVGIQYALNEGTRLEREQFFGELSYDLDITDEVSGMVKTYGGQFESDTLIQVYPPGFSIGPFVYPDGPTYDAQLKNRSLGAEGRLFVDLFKDNNLTIGTLYEWRKQYDVTLSANFNPITLQPYPAMEDVTDWANFNQDEDRGIFAVYLEDGWEISDRVNLMAGVRYDKYSDVGDSTNPRVGLTWRCFEDAYIKLIYGEAFRPPSFLEMYSQNNHFIEGDPDLSPEKVRTGQIGFEYDFFENFKGRVNYFKSYFRDLITLEDSGVELEPDKFVNKDKVELQGFEAELRAEWGLKNYAYANYSYLHSKDKETGEGLTAIPAHSANLGVNIAFLEYFNVNTNIILRGERKRVSADPRDDLSAYGLVNLSLMAAEFWRTLVVQATVYNLFDKQYYDPTPWGTMESDFPKEGRTFMVTARYFF